MDGEPAQRTGGPARGATRPGTSRRRVLRAVAACGVGSGLAACLSTGSGRGRDEVPIVYGYARTDSNDPASLEPRRKTVPATWLRELNHALEAHRGLSPMDLDGFVGSFVVPGDHSDPGASISLHATAVAVRDQVAELSEGVEVEVDVLDELPGQGDSPSAGQPETVDSLDPGGVPGGVLCAAEDAVGSLGPALYDGGTRFFVTANHVYGGSGTDHRGEPLYLHDGDDRATVGRVRRGHLEADLVLAEPANGYTPRSTIHEAEPATVAGQFTAVGLADLQARGEPLQKVGAVSGHTAGQIKGIDGTTFYRGETVRQGQLLWGEESSFTDGDSGSVSYHPDPRDGRRLLVAGVNSARTWWPGSDFTWGTAAYRLRSDLGYSF